MERKDLTTLEFITAALQAVKKEAQEDEEEMIKTNVWKQVKSKWSIILGK